MLSNFRNVAAGGNPCLHQVLAGRHGLHQGASRVPRGVQRCPPYGDGMSFKGPVLASYSPCLEVHAKGLLNQSISVRAWWSCWHR